ncbi:type VII secretion protein EccE [Tsukamurella ocularis]|uniref:type VII secretion protein EccE n=1 Tax=Tsukamurella ocularis TaxID=1970234 RepID=UPI00216868CC|nr:type VII secretion protein EccE [Tsukamurella ocularis]MCS3853328.1 type VII secretion protein EccE [Tsukamurella ocularis]
MIAELLVCAVAAFGPPLWVIAVLAGVAAVVAFVAFDQATLPIWIGRAVRYRWRKLRPAKPTALAKPFAATVPGIGTVGLRWDGRYLVSMISVHGTPHTPTVLVGSESLSSSALPLVTVAELLRQHGGLELAGLDVVSAGRRTSTTEYAHVYDAVVGERPSVGQRATWLVLRLDPDQCAAALGWRVDTGQAAAAATERIRLAIEATGCRAKCLSPAEMVNATKVLNHGRELEKLEEAWGGIQPDGGDFINLYEIPPSSITRAVFASLWSTSSSLTTITLRLVPTRSGVKVGALVRLHTDGPLVHPPVLNLQVPRGRAVAAFQATVPLGQPSTRYDLAMADMTFDDLAHLRIIPGADGQILGNVQTGYPATLPLVDPMQPTLVKVNANLAIVLQTVARAGATGARVAILTDRPALWAPITERGSIYVADPNAAHDAAVIVNDLGDAVPALRPELAGRTVLKVCRTLDEHDADVAITQLDQDSIRVVTAGRTIALSVRFSRSEPRFFQHAMPRPAGAGL